MMTTGTRQIHDICFINLMTPDASKAKAFYARLFGWTYGEMPGAPGGHLILVDGRTGGALMDLGDADVHQAVHGDESEPPPGMPAWIGVMIRVESVDATVAKVNALGGQAEPPMDVL